MLGLHASRHHPGIAPGHQQGERNALPVTHLQVEAVDSADSSDVDTMVDRIDGSPAWRQQLLGLAVGINCYVTGAKLQDLFHHSQSGQHIASEVTSTG